MSAFVQNCLRLCRQYIFWLAFELIVRVFLCSLCHSQINGQYVQDREEAMAALSNDKCRNIVLLVARPEMQVRNDHVYTDALHLSAASLVVPK